MIHNEPGTEKRTAYRQPVSLDWSLIADMLAEDHVFGGVA